MFVFDNSEDLDIATYEYRLYTEDQVEVNPSHPGYYRLIGGASIDSNTITPYSQGFNTANVFTVAVENSTTTSAETVTSAISYYGAVRPIDTSANNGPWTLITKTSTDTPLIDEQFIGSLTAAKITAGTIGAAEITLAGANSIIKSSTYDFDFEETTSGWYIGGDGHFSLGGVNGITYDNETIVIGSNVQVNANFAADSISVGGLTKLNINDGINGGTGGMTLGDPTYNYWYANGNFSVGNETNYARWNGSSLSVTGSVTATTLTATQSGRIGPFSITADSLKSTSYNSENYLEILNYGDIVIYSRPTTGAHAPMRHTTSLVGEYIVVGRNDTNSNPNPLTTSRYVVMGASNGDPTRIGLEIVNDDVMKFEVKNDGALKTYSVQGNSNVAGTGNASYHPSGIYSTGTNWLYGTLFLNGNNIGSTAQYAGTVYMNNWFRSSGSTGWYNETYGGGIYMQDTTWVRTYNNKSFYSAGSIEAGNNYYLQNGGTVAATTSFATTGSSTTARLAAGSMIAGYDAIGRPSSLRELKENIEDINDGLGILNSLRPRKYNFRADAFSSVDPNTGQPWTQEARDFAALDHKYGFIVDEVLAARPDLISYTFENDGSENPNYLDFSKWKPTMWEDIDVLVLCVKAIQELSARVEELESRLI